LAEFNGQLIKKFTTEKELHNSISFLDLSIHHGEKKSESVIYRKSIQTDIIPKDIHMNIKYQVSTTQQTD
jgi:hypothetical protein